MCTCTTANTQAVTINLGAILAMTSLFVPKWYKVWKGKREQMTALTLTLGLPLLLLLLPLNNVLYEAVAAAAAEAHATAITTALQMC
jgi:undecaprenyl pyrophosphate phosphatase UppP